MNVVLVVVVLVVVLVLLQGSYIVAISVPKALSFLTDRNQNFSHILMKICCIKLPWEFLI